MVVSSGGDTSLTGTGASHAPSLRARDTPFVRQVRLQRRFPRTQNGCYATPWIIIFAYLVVCNSDADVVFPRKISEF
jgi:hypothetical protein